MMISLHIQQWSYFPFLLHWEEPSSYYYCCCCCCCYCCYCCYCCCWCRYCSLMLMMITTMIHHYLIMTTITSPAKVLLASLSFSLQSSSYSSSPSPSSLCFLNLVHTNQANGSDQTNQSINQSKSSSTVHVTLKWDFERNGDGFFVWMCVLQCIDENRKSGNWKVSFENNNVMVVLFLSRFINTPIYRNQCMIPNFVASRWEFIRRRWIIFSENDFFPQISSLYLYVL